MRADISANGGRGEWVKYVHGIQGSTIIDWANGATSLANLVPIAHETQIVLVNLGVNDLNHHGGLQSEADFLAQYDTILAAFHARLPTATFYLTKPCMGGGWDADCTTMAGYIDQVITAHPYARAADTEGAPATPGWLDNGDNYATYTYDLVHMNAAGQAEKPNQVRAILDY